MIKRSLLYLTILMLAIACRNNAGTTKTTEMPANKGEFIPATSIKTDLSMFPKTIQGQKMVAIEVPATENEKNFKVEVLVGKTQEVDCNYYFMMGSSENAVLDGWGYNYTVVTSDGIVAGTKMGCPENSQRMDFVHMAPMMFDYNSQFPVVIYVPDFCEVKYRIWTVNEQKYNAISVATEPIKKELIRDCPDGKIINAMPSVGEGGPPREYYIYKGVRRELYEFDEEWLQKNCKIKTTVAH